MGRPKGSVNNPGREETPGEAVDTPEREGSRMAIADPKECPNCGGKAIMRADNQGMIRCHCSECGYWDSVAYRTESEAVEGWNSAGGIPKADY